MPWSVLKMRDDKQRSDQLFSSDDCGDNYKERTCSTEGIYMLLIFIFNISVNYFFDRCNMLLERKREAERAGKTVVLPD